MPPRRTQGRGTGDQSALQPIHPDPLDEHVSYAEFKAAFTTLAYSVVAQNKRPTIVSANLVVHTAAARIRDFTRMNLPSFIRSKSDEDPQEFFDQVQKVTNIMRMNVVESAELAAYQLQDMAHSWFK